MWGALAVTLSPHKIPISEPVDLYTFHKHSIFAIRCGADAKNVASRTAIDHCAPPSKQRTQPGSAGFQGLCVSRRYNALYIPFANTQTNPSGYAVYIGRRSCAVTKFVTKLAGVTLCTCDARRTRLRCGPFAIDIEQIAMKFVFGPQQKKVVKPKIYELLRQMCVR